MARKYFDKFGKCLNPVLTVEEFKQEVIKVKNKQKRKEKENDTEQTN